MIKPGDLPLEEINDNRYTDWAISTPIMILVLCLVLGMENKHSKLLEILINIIIQFLNVGCWISRRKWNINKTFS